MILLQNVYITMLIYAEEKRAFLNFLNIFFNGLTVVFSQLANSWDLMDILLTMNLKQNVRLLTLFVIWGYTVLLAAIKDYQRKLGSELKGSFVVTDAPVWKCLEFFL